MQYGDQLIPQLLWVLHEVNIMEVTTLVTALRKLCDESGSKLVGSLFNPVGRHLLVAGHCSSNYLQIRICHQLLFYFHRAVTFVLLDLEIHLLLNGLLQLLRLVTSLEMNCC